MLAGIHNDAIKTLLSKQWNCHIDSDLCFTPPGVSETILIRNNVQLNIAENHSGLYVIGIHFYLTNKKLNRNSGGFYGNPLIPAPSLLFFCSTILSSGIYSQGCLKVQYGHYSSAIKFMFQAPGRKKKQG